MLCSELSYDSKAKLLLTSPLAAYASLRNGTLAASSRPLVLVPGQRHSPLLPAGTGHSLDIEMKLALPPATTAAAAADTATDDTTGLGPVAATVLKLLVLADPAAIGVTNTSSGFELNASSILVNVSVRNPPPSLPPSLEPLDVLKTSILPR
eukprot:COSAG06_NODE_16848_length_977_cov_1.259681_1_plen_152_part_00